MPRAVRSLDFALSGYSSAHVFITCGQFNIDTQDRTLIGTLGLLSDKLNTRAKHVLSTAKPRHKSLKKGHFLRAL